MAKSEYPRRRGERNPLVPLAVSAVGLIVLNLAQDVPNRHAMEDDLTRRSVQALRTEGIDGEVRFAGRDGTVVVNSAADKDRALRIVLAQEGVRVARVQAPEPVPAPVPAAHVTLLVDGGRVVLTGAVPSQASRKTLVDAATATFGSGNVTDQLAIDDKVSDKGLSGLGGVLSALGPEAKGAVVDLKDDAITLTGTVPSQAVKDAAGAAARQAVGSASAVHDELVVGAAAPQQVQNQLGALPTVEFQTGSARLTAQGQAVVANVATILKANPSVRVGIEGHTDSNGSAAANLALSQARAQAVLATLVSLGIAPDRLTAAGFGESRPKVPDTDEAAKAVNRRVEFVVR